MNSTFTGFNFWTDANMQTLWQMFSWAVGQAAPLLLILLALAAGGIFFRMIVKTVGDSTEYPSSEDYYEEDDY